ncbi:MAG: trimethylamine methyltransferase family protein [Chloroflexi bacterium]|nr:trimethylamine methyltransferase family protein [Chloroflexota bacterium]MCL5075924.1 trimethylamine methyltransferase family protein [Chloroflexota bacterium]
MPRKGFTRKLRPLQMLTEEQVEAIHRATLDVLRETGIRIESDWALDFLAKNGCKVDREAMRVRFPEGLVEECLRRASSSFRVKAPTPENDIILGGNTVYFTHSSGMQTIDLGTFEPRVPTRAEYADCVKVLDALDTVDFLGAYPYFGYEGIPPAMAIPEGVALKIRYSTKHQMEGCSNDNEVFTIQMAQAVGQEITGIVGSSPPLTWGRDAVNAARRIVEAGFPLTTVDGCMMGGTSPATIAGSVVVSNAAQMAMVVLVQLLNPEHRISVGHFSAPVNMNTGSPAFGQIDSSISNAIFNQMWRHYGVPLSNGSPGYAEAKTLDYQGGYEKGIAGILSALSGAHFILLHLGVSSEISAHPVQAILDDDVAGMIGRFIEGEEVNEGTIALELIEEVGPIPGHYLNKAHTRKWWQREQYVPKSADRLTYPEWLQKGKKGALDYAKERLEKILSVHKPSPLTPNQEEDLERILKEAREFHSKAGR